MAEGGFLVKFDGKEVARCFAVAFDYDEWQYAINVPGDVLSGDTLLLYNC
jgi:hypothetical protein